MVVDSSVLVEALRGPGPALERLTGRELFAPHLIDCEVANALRSLVAIGEMTAGFAEAALVTDVRFEITRYPHVGLLSRAWELRENLTMYDAVYVALAEALDVPLVTSDARMARARGVRCSVEVIPAA